MTSNFTPRRLTGLALAAGLLASTLPASADPISDGLYRLNNHPAAKEAPPGYGLRLDELFDVKKHHQDVFTFDFDDAQSEMYMLINQSTIHIYGNAWGGRDVGDHYADDKYRGIYSIDMVYDVGVVGDFDDDDLIVKAKDVSNFGTITSPSGKEILLGDHRNDKKGYSLRIGDEDNDLGHLGFDGMSGWGWLNHGGKNGKCDKYQDKGEWLFIATQVPTPGTGALLALAGLAAGRRRRA